MFICSVIRRLCRGGGRRWSSWSVAALLVVFGGMAAGGLLILLGGGVAGAQVTIQWNNPAGGGWGDAANWSPQNVPNAAGEEAVFPAGGGTFTAYLTGSLTLDRVRIDNPATTLDLSNRTISCLLPDGVRNAGTLLASSNYSQLNAFLDNRPGGLFRIPAAGVHYFNSDSLRNEGVIRIGTAGGAADAILYICNGARPWSGSGECVLESGGTPTRALIRAYSGTFIQAAEHTIRGSGGIYCGFTNYGTILADVPGEELWVHSDNRTNHGVLAAGAGGILVIGNYTTTQGPTGVIRADHGVVRMSNNAHIQGGTLSTTGGGVIVGSTTHYLTDLVNAGRMDLLGGALVYWGGSAGSANDGTVTINADSSATDAILYMYNEAVTLDGDGEIVLRAAGDVNDAQVRGYSGSMIQGPGHTIRGTGAVHAMIDNHGTISADVPGRVLYLATAAKTNRSLMQATNGGILQIGSGDITQDPGAVIRADGGTVLLATSSTVSGGILRSANGGRVQGTGSHFFNDVTNEGEFELLESARSYCGGTSFVNQGTLRINPGQGAGDAILYAYNSTVRIDGSGEFVLSAGTEVGDAQIQGFSGFFVQGPQHTIRGTGLVNVHLTNEGAVRADAPGRTLYLGGDWKINRGLMEAADGARLEFNTASLANEARIVARDGGEVRLDQMGSHYSSSTRTLTGGRWEVHDGSTLRMMGIDPLALDAELLLSGPTSLCCRDDLGTPTLDHLNSIQPAGSLELSAGRTFSAAGNLANAGSVVIGAGCLLTVPGSFVQTGFNPSGIQHEGAGWATVLGTLASPDTLRFGGGTLMGTGTLAGHVRSGARVSPGSSTGAGTLAISGGFVQTADGHLFVELGNTQPGHHDVLTVAGHARLGGRLWIAALEGHTPSAGDVFTVMTFAARTGEFAEKWGCPGVGLDYEIIYEPQAVKIAIVNAPSAVADPADPADPTPGSEPIVGGPTESDPPAEVRLTGAIVGGRSCLVLDLPRAAEVRIEAFDPAGRRVALLDALALPAGRHSLAWTGASRSADRLPSGAYLARATVRDAGTTTVRSARILLVR